MIDNKKSAKILILSILNVFVLSLGHALNIKIIILCSLLCFFLILLISPKSLFLANVLFYLPWSPVMKFNADGYTFYTISFGIFFLYFLISRELFEKKSILKINNLILICLVSIYTMIIKLILGYSLSLGYFIFLLMLVLIPTYLNAYHRKISFETCIIFFSFGIITASLSSAVLMNYSHMLQYINVSEWEIFSLTRLSGFYGDANYYSAHILVSICGLLVLIFNKKFNEIVKLFVLVIFLIYLGLLSVSKMFLFILALILVGWLIAVFIQKGKLITKFSIILCIILSVFFIVASSIFEKQINMYLVRFSMVSDFSSLTTGRSDILSSYFSYFQDNPLAILFGQGFTNIYSEGISYAAHNTIIQTIYQFGLIGSILLGIWLVQLIMSNSKSDDFKRNSRLNMNVILFAIACFGPWFSLDILFADEFFFIISLFLLGQKYMMLKDEVS